MPIVYHELIVELPGSSVINGKFTLREIIGSEQVYGWLYSWKREGIGRDNTYYRN